MLPSLVATPVDGYYISFNGVIKHPSRGYKIGGARYDDRRTISVMRKRYYEYVLRCASFHGPKPFENAMVLHREDIRVNFTSDDLRWGTAGENAEEAHGSITSVRNCSSGDVLRFGSMKAASAFAEVRYKSVQQAFERSPEATTIRLKGSVFEFERAACKKRKREDP